VPELATDEAPPALAVLLELEPPEVEDEPLVVVPRRVDVEVPEVLGADVTDTDGTVPAGVWTAGVDTVGGAGAGAGTLTGAGAGTGTLTGGGDGTGTGTGGGVGTGTDTGGGVGTVTVGTGVCAGTVAAPTASPHNEIEVPTTATPRHQRRRCMLSP
jgi:hypothetical protein